MVEGESLYAWSFVPIVQGPTSTHILIPLYRSKPLKLLTKGDNNLADDTELYAKGQGYLDRSTDIIGSVVGYIPFVGYVTILLSEHPWMKTVLLGLMGVMVVLQRE